MVLPKVREREVPARGRRLEERGRRGGRDSIAPLLRATVERRRGLTLKDSLPRRVLEVDNIEFMIISL